MFCKVFAGFYVGLTQKASMLKRMLRPHSATPRQVHLLLPFAAGWCNDRLQGLHWITLRNIDEALGESSAHCLVFFLRLGGRGCEGAHMLHSFFEMVRMF